MVWGPEWGYWARQNLGLAGPLLPRGGTWQAVESSCVLISAPASAAPAGSSCTTPAESASAHTGRGSRAPTDPPRLSSAEPPCGSDRTTIKLQQRAAGRPAL